MANQVFGSGEAPSSRFARLTPRVFREAWKYLAASAVALGADFAILTILVEVADTPVLVASAISYCSGAVLLYAICVLFVFERRRLKNWIAELTAFFAVGLIGLGLTQIILLIATHSLGLPYIVGKISAVGGSFVANFTIRRALLFTKRKAS